MSLEDNTASSEDVRRQTPRPGRIAALVIAWLLIAGGLAAWALVFPQTLRGYEGFGVEKGLVTFWICVYGFAAGIGSVILLGANTPKRILPKVVVSVYALLLVAVVVSAVVGAK